MTDDVIETNLADLTGLSWEELAALNPDVLQPRLDRMLARLDSSGASISGYNGAGTEKSEG